MRFSVWLTGKKPIKLNSVVFIPEQINAFINAHAPGIGITSISFFIACLTISSPGSEIPGVPASETNAIFCPSNNLLMSTFDLFFSVCL